MKNSTIKNSNASKIMKTYITLRQRIVGTLTALFMLLQVCIPGVASAALLISDDSITKAMTSQLFELSSDPIQMYQQASYMSNQAVVAKTVTDFYNDLRTAKVPVGAPGYVPIAGDITVFIPYYTPGKLIGDTYVQTRYIREQITDLLGRHMIDAANDVDEYAQIKRLYDNAKTFAINNSATYKFGDKLPAALGITLDMIWPERRVINGQSIVVPIVYLKPETITKYAVNDHKIEFLGGTSSFKSITLDDVKLTTGRESVIKTGQLLSYNGSITSGGDLSLMVGGTLNNIGGTISVAGNLNIIGGQINNKTVLVPYSDKFGSGTRLGRIASISAGNNLNIYSKNDIVLEGSTLKSINGSILLNAGGNINIAPVYIQNQGTSKEGQWQVSSSSLNVYGSKLTAAENIKLIADGAVNITASELIATKGGIEILASQGIHIIDELNQEQIQKVDRKGKTRGQSSEFRTEAVRAVLNSGKGVLLDSEHGDVVLKATDIKSTNGTQVAARNGKVHLLMTKELEEFHLQTVRKGTWTIKTKTVDIVHENNIQNTIVGGLQVQAKYGINVEYTGKEGATLKEQVEEFRRMPGMEWMAALYDQSMSSPGQSVNWEVMEEVHKELKKTKRALSPAAMAIIAICMAVVMGPGVGLIGPGGGGIIGGMAANATIGAALNAGALALATQAAQSLAAGNNLRETFNAMDSDESLKSLAIAMVTAGALENTDFKIFEVTDTTQASVAILKQVGQAVTNSAVSAGVSVSISGGNSKEYLKAFNSSLAANAVSTIGNKLSGKITNAPSFDVATKYIAHAAMGCLTGTLTNKIQDADIENGCASGAGGAIVSQLLTSDVIEDKLRKWSTNLKDGKLVTYLEIEKQATYFRSLGVDIAKLSSAFAAFAVGGDVNAAAGSAEMVAKANLYNAINLLELYREFNGDIFSSADLDRKERIVAKYEQDIKERLKNQGVSEAEADQITKKIKDANLLGIIGEYESEIIADGRSFDKISEGRAKATFDSSYNGEIKEVVITGVALSDVSHFVLDFLAATGELSRTLTPAQQQAAHIIFVSLTGGPIRAAIDIAVNYGVDKILPEEFKEAAAEAASYVGTSGIAYIYNNSYEQIKDEALNPLNDGQYEVRDEVDGLTWLVENITGLPGKKGTNTPTYIKENSNGGNNNSSSNPVAPILIPSKAQLRGDFDEHLIKPKKNTDGTYTKDANGGFSGGHNDVEFKKALNNPFTSEQMERIRNDPKYKPGDEKCLILSETKVYDKHGRVVGTEYVYVTPSVEGGKIAYDDKGQIQYKGQNAKSYPKKTTYDPSMISDTQFNIMAKNAANHVWSDGVSVDKYKANPKANSVSYVDVNSGLKLNVIIGLNDLKQIQIGTVHLER